MTTTEPLTLAPGRWVHDPAHSSVGFTVRHLGISRVRGRFTGFATEVAVGEDVAASTVIARIDLATVDTAHPDRDAHIRSADILDVAARPTLVFRSTGFSPTGDGWTLAGEVTIGEVVRPLALAVEFGGIGDFPGTARHAGFSATGELRRSEFGIAPGVPAGFVGDVIRIEIEIQLLEPVVGTG